MKKTDALKPLGSGAMRFGGFLGRKLTLCLENRLRKIRWKHLTEPFFSRTEDDGRWRCEFWGKIIRGAIYTYRATRDAALRKALDETVEELIQAADKTGCISSYPVDKQTQDWDIWGRKYVAVGLADYCLEVEARPEVVEALRRHILALAAQVKASGKPLGDFGWHEGLAASSIMGAVVQTARLSGDSKVLAFAKEIYQSGCSSRGDVYDAALKGVPPEYIGNGKAYEMTSCFDSALELYRETGDPRCLKAARAYWKAVRDTEIFVTGMAGAKDTWGEYWYNGHYTQLRDNVGGMGETCIAATWVKFCMQLLSVTGEAEIADELERTLYNGIAGAMTPDGSWWSHLNPYPLAGKGWRQRAGDQLPGFGEDCCLAQGPTGLALAPYIAVMTHDAGITVNLYEECQCRIALGDQAVCKLDIRGDYARKGQVALAVTMSSPKKFELRLRIPAWSGARTAVAVNGKPVKGVQAGYLCLNRVWKNGDRVEVQFDMAMQVIDAFDGSKRFALQRGPLVLAQDSRLGKVDEPFQPVGGKVVMAPKDIFLAYQFKDGTTVCDYASAGNQYDLRNRLCVWMPRKA
ncbi:MAG: glycoside hydrolase family 127 protein [Victivallales bacterium]|nr:glycoside hydrolase family 127 protein [Victivallales bacterium]